MRYLNYILLVVFFNSLVATTKGQDRNRISLSQETQVLSKGKKSIFRADIYYDREKETMVVHHTYPSEFVKISNRLGETSIWFPATNTVSLRQSESLSTSNDLIYYFVNNLMNDLGLSKEGFSLVSSTVEEGKTITLWKSPPGLKAVSTIKMVFSSMQPLYSEYVDRKGFVVKKIFYSRYSDMGFFSLPLRITEISFDNKQDSTIRLSVFSNIKTQNNTEGGYFNFKIPENATIAR